MTTIGDIREAEKQCHDQCVASQKNLKIAWAKVKPEDEDIISKIRVASPEAYLKLLGEPGVIHLFRRQVLYFGGAK